MEIISQTIKGNKSVTSSSSIKSQHLHCYFRGKKCDDASHGIVGVMYMLIRAT